MEFRDLGPWAQGSGPEWPRRHSLGRMLEAPILIKSNRRQGKSTLFFFFHLHIFAVLTLFANVSESLFYSTVGVEALAQARFLMAVVMLPLTVVYDRITRADRDNRSFAPVILISTLLISALALLVGYKNWLGSFALMILSPILQAFLLAEFWNFANRYFTIQESKRVFPILFGAASIGGITAGLVTSTLVSIVGTESLLLVIIVLNLGCLLFIRKIRSDLQPEQSSSSLSSSAPRKKKGRMRHWLRDNPLIGAIVGLSFVGTVVIYLAEYAYFSVFTAVFEQTDALTEFLGLWSAISSAINLALAFFVVPKLTRLGVGKLACLQPLLALVVFVALFFAPLLVISVAAYLIIFSRNVLEETNEKLLYKGLAPEIAQVIRGRSEGAVKPIAALFSAAVLYLLGTASSPLLTLFSREGSAEFVSGAGVVVAAAYLGFGLLAYRAYPRAIIERIRTRTFEQSQSEPFLLSTSAESLSLLREQLCSEDAELVRFAAEHLYVSEPEEAIKEVLQRYNTAPPEVQAELLELLVQWRPELEGLEEQLIEALCSPFPEVKTRALGLTNALPEFKTEALTKALKDEDVQVRRAATAALCRHWDLRLVAKGIAYLEVLFDSAKAIDRRAAVRIVGQLKHARHLKMLIPLLADEDESVVLATAQVIADNVDQSCQHLVSDLLALVEQLPPAARLQIINALLIIGQPVASHTLLRAGHHLSSQLRMRSAHFLAEHIEDNAELLTQTLADPSLSHGERVVAANALSLIGGTYRLQLNKVARAELTEAYATLRDANSLNTMPQPDLNPNPLDLLHLALADRRREALELVIEIIGFAHQHPDFETIRNYCFSPDPVARAYAIEALENLAERQLFELLLPFLTIDPHDEVELALGELGTRLGLDRSDDDVIRRRLGDPHHWIRACALHVATLLKHPESQQHAHILLQDSDPLVAETANWAIALLDAR